jgi:hypothetical protein
MDHELLFDETEWATAQQTVVTAMTAYLKPYRAPVFEDFGGHGDGWGTGSYIQLGERVFILTNEHVARARQSGRKLIHQFADQEMLLPIVGDHFAVGVPRDLALMPVDAAAWAEPSNGSRAITADQIAWAHAPVIGELLTFVGFAGANVAFHFGTLTSKATCYTAREAALPPDDRFSSRFHFGIDYKPDLATDVIGKEGLPLPPGLSGSTVWNTCFVEAKANGVPWTPELAKVTGVVWGWPSDVGCLVATRAEYLHGLLLGAARTLGNV